MDRSYKKELQIDIDNLIEELADHSNRYAYWYTKQVEAQERKDHAKARLEIIKEELAHKVRKKWQKMKDFKNLDKPPTDKAVASYIAQHIDVKKATTNLITATKETNIFFVAVKAFEARRKMLEKLAEKELQLFWSEPKYGGQAKIEKKVNEKTDSRVHKLHAKKRKKKGRK